MLTRFRSIPLTDPISRRDIVKSKERERERDKGGNISGVRYRRGEEVGLF